VRGALAVWVLLGVEGEVEVSVAERDVVGLALAVDWVTVATGVGPVDGTHATRGDTIIIKKSMNPTRRMIFACCNCACFNHLVRIFVMSSRHFDPRLKSMQPAFRIIDSSDYRGEISLAERWRAVVS
jgi:hypothetical protein